MGVEPLQEASDQTFLRYWWIKKCTVVAIGSCDLGSSYAGKERGKEGNENSCFVIIISN